MAQNRDSPPKQIFWENATPQDFMDAQIGDWIQYVGDITTHYELNFIRNFGGFWSSHNYSSSPAPAAAPEQCPNWITRCKYDGAECPDGAVPCDWTDCEKQGHPGAKCEGYCKIGAAEQAAAKARADVLEEYSGILNSEMPDYDVRARLKHLMRESLRQPRAGGQQHQAGDQR